MKWTFLLVIDEEFSHVKFRILVKPKSINYKCEFIMKSKQFTKALYEHSSNKLITLNKSKGKGRNPLETGSGGVISYRRVIIIN